MNPVVTSPGSPHLTELAGEAGLALSWFTGAWPRWAVQIGQDACQSAAQLTGLSLLWSGDTELIHQKVALLATDRLAALTTERVCSLTLILWVEP